MSSDPRPGAEAISKALERIAACEQASDIDRRFLEIETRLEEESARIDKSLRWILGVELYGFFLLCAVIVLAAWCTFR